MTAARRVPASQRLRAALEDREWTQARLGEEIHVSPGVVSRWLSGERTPSLEMAVRLETALGIPVEAWCVSG